MTRPVCVRRASLPFPVGIVCQPFFNFHGDKTRGKAAHIQVLLLTVHILSTKQPQNELLLFFLLTIPTLRSNPRTPQNLSVKDVLNLKMQREPICQVSKYDNIITSSKLE